ncbi:PadR family transcriptional regulator [Butyrivibrio sp. MC2013]|uniref:PadR family transcriptional regulator n=1 Tax=Butyrivibrio sp. MC2013 TaxID=1280686 RepID=UPI0004793C35|nr:PadR family transcriptional regulator [Butyrivibrio sp. MC2013]
MDAQIKKGILEIIILKELETHDLYGYEIVKKISQILPDTLESTIYAVLRRLKNDGLAQIYYGDESDGPTRKYYTLTKDGIEKLRLQMVSIKETFEILRSLEII